MNTIPTFLACTLTILSALLASCSNESELPTSNAQYIFTESELYADEISRLTSMYETENGVWPDSLDALMNFADDTEDAPDIDWARFENASFGHIPDGGLDILYTFSSSFGIHTNRIRFHKRPKILNPNEEHTHDLSDRVRDYINLGEFTKANEYVMQVQDEALRESLINIIRMAEESYNEREPNNRLNPTEGS